VAVERVHGGEGVRPHPDPVPHLVPRAAGRLDAEAPQVGGMVQTRGVEGRVCGWSEHGSSVAAVGLGAGASSTGSRLSGSPCVGGCES